MVTNTLTAVFFEDAAQMAIPKSTVFQLSNERIDRVDDLHDFDKDDLDQIANNLRRPSGSTAPFTFGAKS